MTDRRNPSDIEDVLSSIRRLVAQDGTARKSSMGAGPVLRAERAMPQTAPASTPAPAAQADQARRLVLSSRHRVAEPENPWTVVENPKPQAPAAEEGPRWSRDEPMARFGDVVKGADAPDPTPTDHPVGDAISAALAAAARGFAETQNPAPNPAPKAEAAPPRTPQPKAADPDPFAEDAEGLEEDFFEDEGETSALFVASSALRRPPPPMPEPATGSDSIAPADEGVILTEEADFDDLGEMGDGFGGDADALTLDEDALRALIAKVVHEELQGEMGQRITRNLRKLVRREIRMVLAAEGLE